MDMNEFFTCCIPEDEQRRVQALEPFDEYEVILLSVERRLFCVRKDSCSFLSERYLRETILALQSSWC